MSEQNVPFVDDGEIVCHCFGVSAYAIKCAIFNQGLDSVEQVSAATKAGLGCQSCHFRITELIDEVLSMKNNCK